MSTLTKPTLLMLPLLLGLTACDPLIGSEPSKSSEEVPLGCYREFGERLLIGRQVLSERRSGSYGYQTICFGEEDVELAIVSDIVSENGVAKGRYEVIEGTGIRIVIESSETPLYEPEAEVRYESFEVVNETYRKEFNPGTEHAFTFQGPGLVLVRAVHDGGDLDGDGDTKEEVMSEVYLSKREK